MIRRLPRTLLALTLLPHAAFAQRPAPAWTHGATCYEVFVRSFYDANGDGVGDLNGLTAKLDYIRGLGVSCIWLMPIAESPSYHGYDVSDYYKVQPAYGTAEDFRRLMKAAHQRGLKVILDMVLNHSSNQHPHFQAALRDTMSPYRHWYIFSPKEGGKGPWGAPAWHKSPVRDEYYYGIFSAEMPDLDYHTPAVRAEGEKIADYWLKQMGVDGFRLDAVQYLVEDGSCLMDCPGTHAYLHEWGAHVHASSANAYAVGEVWDPLDTLLTYYPDQLTSYFTFTLADSLLLAVRRDTAGGMLAGFLTLQAKVPDQRWSPLLRNHDATRTLTFLDGDWTGARLSATLLLTLPGLPFVYYGEEIGMTGDKPDPRLRTPMQWNAGPGGGFTTGKPWESLQSDVKTTNVATEDTAAGSLLNLYRKLIHLRRTNKALSDGKLVPLTTADTTVVAYLRRSANHTVMLVANLSRAVRAVAIGSAAGVLPAGRYQSRDLLSGGNGPALVVGKDGKISGYAPGSIPARTALVLDFARRP